MKQERPVFSWWGQAGSDGSSPLRVVLTEAWRDKIRLRCKETVPGCRCGHRYANLADCVLHITRLGGIHWERGADLRLCLEVNLLGRGSVKRDGMRS